ncbi:MAG: NAD(P)H-hydrate dehydratase [Chloroflexota bacterium]|nr:NAD(P)H-hydrate dehydratase [Chloroflexota bacterium]
MAGSVALSALAASRSGAGIVVVAVPRGLAATVTAVVPEAVLVLLPDGETTGTARRAGDMIEEKLERSAALLIGPGLGQDETASALLSAGFGFGGRRTSIGFGVTNDSTSGGAEGGLFTRSKKPVVVDADALNWLAEQDRWWERLPPGQAILTPHVGEMSRLLGQSPAEVIAEPVAIVKAAAKRWRQTVLLKYGYSVASDGDQVIIAEEAPLSLASAGTGDVLAGMIGALLAQGLRPIDAAAVALYVGPRAARRVEARVGTLGLIASDLPYAIAEELAELERGRTTTND